MKVHSSQSGGKNLLQKNYNNKFTAANAVSSMMCMCW